MSFLLFLITFSNIACSSGMAQTQGFSNWQKSDKNKIKNKNNFSEDQEQQPKTDAITLEEARLLYPFFQTAFKYSEAGYVFYDQKPLCVDTFCEQLYVFEPSDWHEISVSLSLAKNVLKRPIFQTGNFVIHIDEKNEMILYINKKLFLETVANNIVLFQYILGPAVTPESLFASILFSGKSLFSVLNDDDVLIGIVLGYGVQNSLYGSRMEHIMSAKLSADIPPDLPKFQLCVDDFEKQVLLCLPSKQMEKATKEHKYLKPSFGFSSLKEEAWALENKIQISSEQLNQTLPVFVFGCIKEDQNNQKLLQVLEKTQGNIQLLLKSPTFLKDILEKILGEAVDIENVTLSPFPLPNRDINLAAAKLLKNSLKEDDERFHSLFGRGLLEDLEDHLDANQRLLGMPEALHNLKRAKTNAEEADHFFGILQNNPNFIPILNRLLYYQIIETGQGRSLQGETKVTLDFDIFDPRGKCLRAESNYVLDTGNVLPGFLHGLQGMKIGEKREIYIHPSLAYGVHTFLEKGIYLKVAVKLLDMQGPISELSTLEPKDLSVICDDQFQKECEDILKQEMTFLGSLRGRFFKSCSYFDIRAIAENFNRLNLNDLLSNEEAEALNQVSWNFYFSNTH